MEPMVQGEYPLVGKFASPVAAFSITFYGAQGKGNAYINLYDSDGILIGEIVLPKVTNGPYYFIGEGANIAGFSLWNNDVGGLAIYEIRHNGAAGGIDCSSTWDEGYGPYTLISDNFDGSGDLNGTAVPVLDGGYTGSWIYSSPSASKSGGTVSPANFSLFSDGEQLTFYAMLCSVNLDENEVFTINMPTGNTSSFTVELAWGSGNLSKLEYVNTESPEVNTQTFSIGAYSNPNIIFGFELNNTMECKFYLHPDYSTPYQVLGVVGDSFPIYGQGQGYTASCTGNNTSVDFIRFCSFAAP